jgi:hypothetical protein
MKQIICVSIIKEFKSTFLAKMRSLDVLIIKNDCIFDLKIGDKVRIEAYEKTKRYGNGDQKRIFEPLSVTMENDAMIDSSEATLLKLIQEIRNDIKNNKRSKAFSEAIRLLGNNKDLSALFEEVSLEYRTFLIKMDFDKITKLLNNNEDDKTAEAKKIIDDLLERKGRFRGLYPLLKELYKLSNEVESRSKIENKENYTVDMYKNRYLVLAGEQLNVGENATYKRRKVEIIKIGKKFILDAKNNKVPDFLKKKWVGKEVSWIYFTELDGKRSPEEQKTYDDKIQNYYEKNTTNPKQQKEIYVEKKHITKSDVRNHIWASKTFMEYVVLIKSKGIKPRHKSDLIEEIKRSEIICDNRKMIIEGGSWVAINSRYVWYITFQLSSLAFDNNIRINNQPAQCWRMMRMDAPEAMIDELREIHEILFNH